MLPYAETMISFEVRLDKIGDEPGWECVIGAKGQASRVGSL